MGIRFRLLVMFLAVVAVLGAVMVYANHVHRQNLHALDAVRNQSAAELESTRRTQFAFERQKEAWGNLMLRGHEPEQYHRYLSEFYTQERATRVAVETLLATLEAGSPPYPVAEKFLEDHWLLGKRYRDALRVFNQADDPAFSTDRYIQGAAENPSALLEKLIELDAGFKQQRLAEMAADVERQIRQLWIFSALVFLVAISVFVWFVDLRIGRPLKCITGVAKGIRDGNVLQRVPVQYKDEIGVLGDTLNAMLDKLEGSNRSLSAKLAELEQEVARRRETELMLEARKIELEEMNEELESFSYTIAHDLRGPLRAITGFSQLLQDDLKERVDAEQKDALDRISAAGLRMADLIDHILQLSRISRDEIRIEDIDLSALAEGIVKELRCAEPEREVEVEIEAGLSTRGDARLLRVVLQNLLYNAWKYTRKQPHPVIRFSGGLVGGESVYRVSDNGAGFDMCYAHKLFGVFERLHSQTEFEGTGIGLASVQRAVRRHGGRIWGEGELQKGAVFSFTLNGGGRTRTLPRVRYSA